MGKSEGLASQIMDTTHFWITHINLQARSCYNPSILLCSTGITKKFNKLNLTEKVKHVGGPYFKNKLQFKTII
jgi:hypothetical protein